MTNDAFPILIGITGKRNFAHDSAANDAIRAKSPAAWRTVSPISTKHCHTRRRCC